MQLQLSALLSLLTVALFAVPALSVSITVYTSNSRCIGTSFTYLNVVPGRCITNVPTGYGHSVSFQGLPLGSVGDGFVGPSCATRHLFELTAQGAGCWSSLSNGLRAGALSWQRFRRSGGLVEDGQTKGPAPSLFTYDDHTGVQNTIVVPADDEDAAQKIADLYEANDFEALAKYEKGE
ncbi:hypothetical protein K443DRAFT_125952 [Laccaria amethystina LaAM-08-1]|uniref:Unplaced genomic scaffold K443scaffold_375, whole genome shotgun sequence n=1 Tax=Laccaria amethystina LaAM-08-1 TaxID=1095629 RepID=A0A0C9WI71_9AGAR|nr:hypothetical protein K443DRAFT_125952 [Laccaria amethystina LaAM-08-1]